MILEEDLRTKDVLFTVHFAMIMFMITFIVIAIRLSRREAIRACYATMITLIERSILQGQIATSLRSSQ